MVGSCLHVSPLCLIFSSLQIDLSYIPKKKKSKQILCTWNPIENTSKQSLRNESHGKKIPKVLFARKGIKVVVTYLYSML